MLLEVRFDRVEGSLDRPPYFPHQVVGGSAGTFLSLVLVTIILLGGQNRPFRRCGLAADAEDC
jgi:hypothetical protein